MNYKCKCRTVNIEKATIVVKGNKAVTKEAYCVKCKEYATLIKDWDGWGTIVSKKGGKV